MALVSVIVRFLFPVILANLLVQPALTQELPPYQPLDQRQICDTAPILDEPGGRAIGTTVAGTQATFDQLRFGTDGTLYYHLADTTPPGFVATAAAPHFCAFADRQRATLARFTAVPNACHMIIGSRQTLDEVNDFAAQYPDFLAGMSVYRAENGWYAVSVGQVSLAVAPALLAESQAFPPDSYCSDGTRYRAVMDLREGRFVEPDPAVMEPLAFDCLTKDALACAKHAKAIYPKSEYVDQDFYDQLRYGFLGCMGGDALGCELTSIVRSSLFDKVVLNALPDAQDHYPSLEETMKRIGCDAGLVASCKLLGGAESARISGDRIRYLTSLQSLITACHAQDPYGCRDVLRLLEKYERVMGQPAPAEDIYQSAHIWSGFCSHFADDLDESCRPVYAAYAGVVDNPATSASRAAEMTEFIRKGCASGVPQACVLYSNLSLPDAAQRDWGAQQARVTCTTVHHVDDVCDKLDGLLPTGLPTTDKLQQAEFDKLVSTCHSDNTPQAKDACSEAFSYFVRMISQTEIAPVEAALTQACTPDLYSGCETLAFLYSPYTMVGENLRFTGIDEPDKRLAALRQGCRPGPVGLINCNNLGDMLQERGDQQGAQGSYRTACNTVQTSSSIPSNGACFKAGLHVLRKLDDRTTARADFIFTCDNPRDSNSPYACKHLALMDIEEGAKESDPLGLIATLHRSCYPAGDFRGDGEGCLYYGQTLLELRDRLHWKSWEEKPVLDGPDPITDLDQYITAKNASYVFSRGCLSRWRASCEANDTLIADWIAGAYPRKTTTCQIRSSDQTIRSEKTCEIISYARPQVVEYKDGYIYDERLYFWPDGDRTLVTEGGEQIKLNGNPARFYPSQDGSVICQQNPETGNSFCTGTDDAEGSEG